MDANAMIRRALALILAVPIFALAEGPLYGHKDGSTQLEFENVYNDIRSASSGGTTDPLSVSTLTVTSSATIRAPLNMSGFKIISVANGTATTDAAAFGQLKFVQIKQNTTATQFSTTSSTFQDAGLSISITPTSASNYILFFVSTVYQYNAAGVVGYVTVKRGSTDLGGASSNGFAIARIGSAATSGGNGSLTFAYMDAPATTSATTYSVFVRSGDNATTFFCPVGVQISTIIVAEVAL